jgi:hypothetical protein
MHMRTSSIFITGGLAGVIANGTHVHPLLLNLRLLKPLTVIVYLNVGLYVLVGLAFAIDGRDNLDDAQAVLTQTRTLFNPYIGATIESVLGVGSDGMTTFLLYGAEAWNGTTCE